MPDTKTPDVFEFVDTVRNSGFFLSPASYSQNTPSMHYVDKSLSMLVLPDFRICCNDTANGIISYLLTTPDTARTSNLNERVRSVFMPGRNVLFFSLYPCSGDEPSQDSPTDCVLQVAAGIDSVIDSNPRVYKFALFVKTPEMPDQFRGEISELARKLMSEPDKQDARPKGLPKGIIGYDMDYDTFAKPTVLLYQVFDPVADVRETRGRKVYRGLAKAEELLKRNFHSFYGTLNNLALEP